LFLIPIPFLLLILPCIDLPADIVPATFKKKKAAVGARVKGEDEDEKPGRPTEETSRPTGLGRGTR
jgi:hypothetical protein